MRLEAVDQESVEKVKIRQMDAAATQREQVRKVKDLGLDLEHLAAALKGELQLDDDQESAAAVLVAERKVAEEKAKADKAEKKKNKLLKNKPKWALTPLQNEDMQEEEVDALLDFAANLDYDQFLENMEETEAERILEVDRKMQEKKEALKKEQEERQRRREAGEQVDEPVEEVEEDTGMFVKQVAAAKRKMQMCKKERNDNDVQVIVPVPADAAKMIKNDERFKNVHSTASVKQLIKSELEKVAVVHNEFATSLDPNRPIYAIPPPVIYNHGADPQLLNPSRLPYIFRHPAV